MIDYHSPEPRGVTAARQGSRTVSPKVLCECIPRPVAAVLCYKQSTVQ